MVLQGCNLRLRYVKAQSVEENILQTTIEVSINDSNKHTVEHIQWMNWPDRGVPPTNLSSFRLLTRVKLLTPIVVHCSAGIGRTGVIVGLDLFYSKLQKGILARELCDGRMTEVKDLGNRNQWLNPVTFLADVFCTDETRVVLSWPPGENDYIHANWVSGSDTPKKFICTQAPTKNTVEDFWRMIWQEGCKSIVMLCNITECGKKKCEQYWPETSNPTVSSLSFDCECYRGSDYTIWLRT
ncbi:Protein-tyrosine phosphatase [Ancylostoma caninum]|uniref:Protein-tyrosine phosphatase n=1 Tax=Ancylostoma caninum TaxID=29170 RepID=A0A368GMF1_ANCCA|nr:Protein-tyrosine phosphatase [Ancylostoma caninum]